MSNWENYYESVWAETDYQTWLAEGNDPIPFEEWLVSPFASSFYQTFLEDVAQESFERRHSD